MFSFFQQIKFYKLFVVIYQYHSRYYMIIFDPELSIKHFITSDTRVNKTKRLIALLESLNREDGSVDRLNWWCHQPIPRRTDSSQFLIKYKSKTNSITGKYLHGNNWGFPYTYICKTIEREFVFINFHQS